MNRNIKIFLFKFRLHFSLVWQLTCVPYIDYKMIHLEDQRLLVWRPQSLLLCASTQTLMASLMNSYSILVQMMYLTVTGWILLNHFLDLLGVKGTTSPNDAGRCLMLMVSQPLIIFSMTNLIFKRRHQNSTISFTQIVCFS